MKPQPHGPPTAGAELQTAPGVAVSPGRRVRPTLATLVAASAAAVATTAGFVLLWYLAPGSDRGSYWAVLACGLAAGLLVGGVVDRLAARFLHEPLAHTLETVRRAVAGDRASRALVFRNDEIGAVAAGLNELLDRHERLSASLQERVEQATAELTRRNDALVASYQRMFGLREALARAQQTAAAGQTAANLAHQIGTPLNLASGWVQMMLETERQNGDERKIARLASVDEQLRKVSSIISTTLTAVRQVPAAHEPLFPGAVLRRIAEVARPRLTAAGISLDLDVEDDLPWLLGDTVQLELALLNLVNNSLDALTSGGRIRISAAWTGSLTRIEITDDGPGIPTDLVSRIFDPWVTTKPVGRGTGLGLSITREVISAHAGTIAVRSEPGTGTTFTIELPGKPDAPAVREV